MVFAIKGGGLEGVSSATYLQMFGSHASWNMKLG